MSHDEFFETVWPTAGNANTLNNWQSLAVISNNSHIRHYSWSKYGTKDTTEENNDSNMDIEFNDMDFAAHDDTDESVQS
eukprot:2254249-Ditylum_brightwellii.AAC.1